MPYVDGFLLTVQPDKLEAYRAMAAKAGKIWMEYGALEFHECVLDDPKVDKARPMPEAAGAKEGELTIFSYIVYSSREERDAINKKVMADPRLSDNMEMPFDMSRMAYGGFKSLVHLSAS